MTRLVIVIALVCAARAADAKGCHEVSHVVGHEKCTWFGTWSREVAVPRIWFELGYFDHHYDSAPFTLGSAPLTTGGAGSERWPTIARGPTIRAFGGMGHILYVGGELLPGFIAAVPRPIGIQPTSESYFGAHAVVGAHVEMFRLALGTELAAGFRYEQFDNCMARSCLGEASQARGELELHVRADFFLDPQASIGVTAAKSLVERDDTAFLLTLGFHIRALDGMW